MRQDPWLLSKSRRNPDKLALVLDSYHHVFGHNLQEVFSAECASRIDALEWTSHENFLIVALANGSVQFVHVPTQKILPAITICEPNSDIGKPTFAGLTCTTTGAESVFSFFTTSGRVS